jgi:hypothetical protein
MKNLRLIIYIVVILAIVCSPALAISMSDLIAQHQGESPQLIERLEFDEDTPLGPAPPYYPWYLTPVIPIPAIEPTTIPTPVIPSSYFMRERNEVVYWDEVILVNERYNIYADRHGGWNLHFNPVIRSDPIGGYFGQCPPMHYESGMVR